MIIRILSSFYTSPRNICLGAENLKIFETLATSAKTVVMSAFFNK